MARNAVTPLVAALLAIGGYGAVLGWLSWNEDAMVFPVDQRTRALVPPDPTFGLNPRRVEAVTADGVRLVGWVMADPEPADSAVWMLVFHGNGENVSNVGRTEHYLHLRALGLNVVAFDYRGYGESEGRPSEAGLYRDADAMWAFARDSLGIAANRIVLYGHSLGTAVAVELASRTRPRAVVLEGAFTSLADVGRRLYPFVPVRLLARNRFASADVIGRVSSPLLFLHARGDNIVPPELGRALYELAPEPKRFVELAGGHNDAYVADPAAYFDAIAGLLR
ncbi:MAG TPA: alpha/beta hydrolase [Gemmatimonadales bacterium]|nr:alpha/beta hydrolase [Gemmatimonadales bacterium]